MSIRCIKLAKKTPGAKISALSYGIGCRRDTNSVSQRRRRVTVFYLPHMEYEGSIGMLSRKMNFFYCLFSRFSPSVTRRGRCRCKTKIVSRLRPPP
jgi:hypothetical protein